MRRISLPLTLVMLAGALAWLFVRQDAFSQPPAVAEKSPYTTAEPSKDGIGKFFHGREIAQVMGHPGIGWLERDEREQEEAPTRAIKALGLAKNAVIADVGAGSGYYAFRISPEIPEGKVVAVDIQPEMLAYLKDRSKQLSITNVEPHLGAIDDLKLAPDSLDAVLMVDAYHEFSHPAEMLASIHRSLKAGGRIYLLEFRAEDPRVPIKPLHKMTEAQAKLELEGAGFRFVSNRRHLPWQHFMVFEKPKANP
ncbi:MAG TPA: class I SAM-dependent methyltransferase [Luteolibacter sp.]|nr:class I SAM-dependent methyltransferase [Luteolibacter sp.]